MHMVNALRAQTGELYIPPQPDTFGIPMSRRIALVALVPIS
jgi:hypothetical protein